MNLGVIAKPNSKGQVVIPKKYREKLGIDENVFLNVSLRDNGVYLAPIYESAFSRDSRELFLEVLRKTAGTWKADSWPEVEKKRRKIELAASVKRKKPW